MARGRVVSCRRLFATTASIISISNAIAHSYVIVDSVVLQSPKSVRRCITVLTSIHHTAQQCVCVCVCMERSEYVLRDGAERARDQLERYQSLVKRRKTGGQTEKDEREERVSLREERRHSSCSRFYCVRHDGGKHVAWRPNERVHSSVNHHTVLLSSVTSHHSLQYVPNSC